MARIRGLALAGLVALLSGATTAHAATKVVGFDDLAPGTTVGAQYAAPDGVSFDQPADPGNAPVVRSLPGQAHSGSQVADFDTYVCPPPLSGSDCEFAPPGSTRGQLDPTASSVRVWVGVIASPFPGNVVPTIQLTAYDGGGDVIGQSAAVPVTAGAAFVPLEVDSPTVPIKSFGLADTTGGTTGSVAMDDLQIGTPDTPQPPDFSLLTGFGVLDVLQGESVSDPLTISRANGSNGDVTLGVSGLPAGMTGAFSPNPVPGTSTATTLTLTAAAGAAAATDYTTATITATPSAGAGSAPRTAALSTRITENCSKTVLYPYVDVRDDGCLQLHGTSQYVAVDTDVRIDGLVLHPLDGDHVLTIDPVAKTITSDAGATYSVSVLGDPDLPFYYGPISWSFKTDTKTPVPLANQTQGKPKQVIGLNTSGVPLFQGIPLTGMSVVFTSSAKAVVTPTLKLDFFPFNYFGAITVSTSFITDNDNGASFNGIEIKVPKLDALALELKDVDLKYSGPSTWSGSATAVLDFADKLSVGAGFGIKNGSFAFLKGSVANINTAIGAGIYLQSLGFEVDTNPTKLIGTIGLSAGPAVAGKKAVTFTGGVTAVLADPWMIEVDGSAKLGDKYSIGNAFLSYSSTGLFKFGGSVHLSLDVVTVDGKVTGWVAGLHNFDVEGSVKGCISIFWGIAPCASAQVLVSNLGIAGCVLFDGYGAGVASHWGDDFDAFTGCDLGPWRPTQPTSRAFVAKAAQRLTVPAGQSQVAWSIDGTGGTPPDVTVVGPGHASVSVSKTVPYIRNAHYFAAQASDGRTYVIVNHPRAGTWTIAADGPVPITRIRQAVGLPKPKVTAKVGGRGRKRVLRWSLRPIPGQVVQFAEIGKDVRSVIATTSKVHGQVRFTPADGSAGKRTIEAIVQENHQPRTTITVATYRAPGMAMPAKPRALKLTRKGTTIVVSWKPHPSGFRVAVYLELADGRRLLKIVAASRHSATFTAIATTVAAKATVTGLTTGNSKGPAAHASLKAKAKPKTPAQKRVRS